jgi:uncharacterized protein with ParB-like and HNH nuclease domain
MPCVATTAESSMELTTTARSLRDVLKAHFFFIPRFQRPYSWGRDQVQELWEDAIQEASGEYFIGSMVVYKYGEDTRAVIDGQQRLTTLMMLLCALRDAADEHGLKSLANGTQGFIERSDENDNDRFVLKTETSYPYLQDRVLSRDEPQLKPKAGREERSIKQAFDRVRVYVDDAAAAVLDDPSRCSSRSSSGIVHRRADVGDPSRRSGRIPVFDLAY